MYRKLGLARIVCAVIAVVLALGITPASVKRSVTRAVMRSTGTVFQTVGTVAVPPKTVDPLKASVLNVTTDFDELSSLLCEFMRTQPASVSLQFQSFMAERATRSYPRIEGMLDWLLSAYKFAFPFLILSILAKFSSRGSGSGTTEDGEGEGGVHGQLHEEGSGQGQDVLVKKQEQQRRQLLRSQSSSKSRDAQLLRRGSSLRESSDATANLERLPSRGLSKSLSAGREYGGVSWPGTPVEGQGRLDVHQLDPAQLQKSHSNRRHHPHPLHQLEEEEEDRGLVQEIRAVPVRPR